MNEKNYYCAKAFVLLLKLLFYLTKFRKDNIMSNKSTNNKFHKTQTDKSKVKTLIVTEFFKAYFPIINAGVGKQ